MGEDEVGTLAALTSHISEVFEPEITAQTLRICANPLDGLGKAELPE